MADTPIKIRIGASVDSSTERAFASIEKRAQKAAVTIQRGQKQTATSAEKEARREAAAKQKSAKQIEQAAARVARAQEREARRLAKASEALDRQRASALFANYRREQREQARTEAAKRREIEKTLRAAERAQARERNRKLRAATRSGESFARRTSHRATRFMMPEMPIGSVAARVGRDIAGGLGVDLSLQGGLQRSVQLQAEATQLANQERIATGRTRGAAAYSALARQIGDDTIADPQGALQLGAKFAARTGTYGNLDEIMPQLASLARASGADYEQVGEAAGMVFQQLRGQADAVNKTVDVMRAIIGQSAEGAVDMPDYAKQLGRVAAGAFKFEGDRARNVAALSALTQIAMERGATSAADAARSTSSFVNTLGKGARIGAFHSAGVRLFTDDTIKADGKVEAGAKSNQLRPLEDIIKDSFRATGGNIPMLGGMFMDVLGRKGVESLGAEYQAAGGGEAGIKAIEKVFDRYMNATISKDVEQQNIADVGNTAAGKAQRFQNQLDRVTEGMMSRLVPALETATPTILEFASVLGRITTWAVENPKTAIAGAISMSIARAGIESTFRAGIERAILGANKGRAPVVGNVAGGMGGAMTLATLGISVLTVASLYADALYTEWEEQRGKGLDAALRGDDAMIAGQKAIQRGDMDAELAALQNEIKSRQVAVQHLENSRPEREDFTKGEFWAEIVGGMGNLLTGNMDTVLAGDRAREQEITGEKERLAEAVARLAEVQVQLALTMQQGITVKNMPAPPPPPGVRGRVGYTGPPQGVQ